MSFALLSVVLLSGCHHPPNANAIGRALDAKLAEVYLHKDWTRLAAIVAPDYYGSGDGFEWNRADLQQEFPKINLQDFYLERQRVKQLASGVLLVTDVATLRETYAGRDISGRYLSSDVWVKRNGQWLLLVEQETRRTDPLRSRTACPFRVQLPALLSVSSRSVPALQT